jgi:hypothetical protein
MATTKRTPVKRTPASKGKTTITIPMGRNASNVIGSSVFNGSNPHYGNQRSGIVYGSSYDNSFNNLVTTGDLSELRGIARYLYSNLGAVKKAINEMASLSTTNGYKCNYIGKSVTWGNKVESFVNKIWWNNSTMKGQSFGKVLEIAIISLLRDGECFIVLTEDENKFPKLQCISANRVGNRKDSDTYKSYPIKNGIVYDPYGRVVGYKVLGEKDDGSQDQIVDSADCIHVNDPAYFEEGRSVPALSSATDNWKDYFDIVFYEKRKHKLASSITLKEHNATGTITTDDSEYADHLVQTVTAQSGSGIWGEEVMGMGGEIRYFKAGSGEDLSVLEYDSPGTNALQFLEGTVLRGAFAALGWPMELSWNPSQLRGAPSKMLIGLAQRRLDQIAHNVLLPLWNRVVPWVVAKSIKHGFLPEISDWYMLKPTPVRELTVDEFRNSQSDINDLKAGFTNYNEVYSKWGLDWSEAIAQRIKEQKFIEDECAAAGVDINRVQNIFPNPMPVEEEPVAEDPMEDEDETKEDTDDSGDKKEDTAK